MQFKTLFVTALLLFIGFNPVFADEVTLHKLMMVVAGSSKAFYAEGDRFEIKYVSGSEEEKKFCLADELDVTKCYELKTPKKDEVAQYEFCFSSGECITFKLQEFSEKYLNIQTVTFKK